MAVNDKKILYRLEADNRRLNKNLSSAEKRLERYQRRTNAQLTDISKKFRSNFKIYGLIGAAITGAIINNSAKAIDANAKFADSVGLTTEQLAGYKLQADITGASIEQFQKGTVRLQKSINDAVNGLSTAKRAFDTLGLDPESLRLLDTDQQIKQIADSFNNLTNQTDKTGVAVDLFGRSGVGLVKFLEEGSQGIESFRAEAEALGLTFSRIDAAKVEVANDAITRAKGITTGLGQALAIELAPAITAIADEFVEAAKAAGGLDNVFRTGIDYAVKVVGTLADGFHGLRVALKAAELGTARLFEKFESEKLDKFILKLKSTTKGLFGEVTPTENVLTEVNFGSIADDLEKEFDDLVLNDLPSKRLTQALEKARVESEAKAKEIADAVNKGLISGSSGVAGVQTDVVNEFKSVIESLIPPVERYKTKQIELTQALKEGKIDIDEYNLLNEHYGKLIRENSQAQIEYNKNFERAQELIASTKTPLERLNEQLMEARQLNSEGFFASEEEFTRVQAALEDQIAQLDEMSTFGDQAARNMQDAFADFIVDTSGGFDGLADSFAKMLQRMAAEALAANVFEFLKVDQLLGGGGGGFNLGDIFGGFFADGGFLGAGKFGIAGENGPELITGPANIMSADSTARMAGDNISMVFNISAPNEAAGRKAAGQTAREVRRALGSSRYD